MVEALETTTRKKHELNKLLHKHIWYNKTLGIESWCLFSMLAVLLIAVIENVVFWSMKKKAVATDDFLFALRNYAELETIEKLYVNLFKKFLLLKNADFYLEEALRNQTHDEVIRFLYRNFEFSENVNDRKFMMLALKNTNPDITRLYLDEYGDK